MHFKNSIYRAIIGCFRQEMAHTGEAQICAVPGQTKAQNEGEARPVCPDFVSNCLELSAAQKTASPGNPEPAAVLRTLRY
jgi:hypothetical protein